MASKTVKIEGCAVDWGVWVNTQTGRRTRFAIGAFREWRHTASACFPTLLIDHDEQHELPRAKTAMWKETRDGLMVTFHLDVSDRTGRGAYLAIRHGFLNGLSLGSIAESSRMQADGLKCTKVVDMASIAELSLTDSPACPNTWVSIFGHERAKTKTMPADMKDRAILLAFLLRVGYDTRPTPIPPPPKPIPPRQKSVLEIHRENQATARFLEAYANAQKNKSPSGCWFVPAVK